jgi:hypothetical protein
MSSPLSKYTTESVNFKNVNIRVLQSSQDWQNLVTTPKASMRTIIVPAGCDGRPDLLSLQVYGTVKYWWVLCAVNNITNPLTDFESGLRIYIPTI